MSVRLRRADWRFLLPPPPPGGYRHLVLLGGPDALGERLATLGVAKRVSRSLASSVPADLVVLLSGARKCPAEAASVLTTGGALYVEVDRRLAPNRLVTPSRMERTLRAAGLSIAGSYWIFPDLEHSRRYLPLDLGPALDWYLNTLHPPRTLAGALVALGLRTLSRGRTERLAPWVPCYGIAAVRGAPRPPSILAQPEIAALVGGGDVRTAVLTSGVDDGSRVVMLPFRPGERSPALVIKASRLPAFNGHTEREQATLRQLRDRLDADLRPTLPEPLGLVEYENLSVGLESAAAGPSLAVTSGAWRGSVRRAIEDLEAATRWLAAFHRRVSDTNAWTTEWAADTEARFARYRDLLRADEAEAALLELAGRRAWELVGRSMPVVWLHNDFGPWNVHRAGNHVTVIDWEYGGAEESERTGPGLCDLLYFLATWGLRVWQARTPARELECFRRLHVEPERGDPVAAAAHGAIARYMADLEIDREFYPLILVRTWAERALDRFDRQGTSDERRPDPRSGNPYAAYVGALASARERLFCPGDQLS